MNTSLSWIKQYVPDLDVTPQEYCDGMTLSGTKVENYKKLDADLDKIVVKADARKNAENGNALRPDQMVSYSPENEQDKVKPEQMYENGTRVRLYDETGVFFGVYRYDAKKRVFLTETFLFRKE